MHLYLVDSSIFVFRAWYGAKSYNPAEEPNQAFVGFSDFVYRLLTEQAPSHIVFAFDESLAQSARKEIYPEYKANRSPAPAELKRQFAWCREWLDALGLSHVGSTRREADDLIGALAHYHRREDLPAAFLTADKDLAQLVCAGDIWWSYLDNRILDYRAINKQFGVRPDQIAELLALTGDKVDNIPGIPGIGPKTAARLLKKYDSIENLRRHLDEVASMKLRYAARVQQSLIDNEDLLDTSLSLTRIECEIEEMREVRITRGNTNAEQVEAMMQTQGFDQAQCQRWHDFLSGSVR